MGEHIDNRKSANKKFKKQNTRERDPSARQARASFKQYLRDLDESLMEEDLSSDDDFNDDYEVNTD